MGQVCRVCEKTFEKCRQTPSYCTALLDTGDLEKQCIELELDLKDSCTAWCFTCRHISMSVPKHADAIEQICYIQSQVQCYQMLIAYNLVIDEQ